VAAVWREAGQEFGATTGRPRRCGWLDVAALRTAARINGLTALAVTKLDILDGRDSIRVCVGYETSGGVIDELPAELEGASPVYQDFPGWNEAVREARELAALPKNARAYIDAIAELTGVPVGLVSVGPGRDETIAIEAPFN
jgi:adenylosuccinate synthase